MNGFCLLPLKIKKKFHSTVVIFADILINRMKKAPIFFITIFLVQVVFAQTNSKGAQQPKLVVGIVVDQMRWDFLSRYANRYSANGFNRLMSEGFNCENTFIPYAQTVTAAGHASIYTGSVPAINGIMGNEWYDRVQKKMVYCTEDASVKTIGSSAEPQSPKNLWVNTICDELKMATNFQSKVIGISIKDRGGILPAGHTADAAYWYDTKSGSWISSTYYMQKLPDWVDQFNSKKLPDSLYKLNWNTLHPIDSYKQSDKDDMSYEGKFAHEQKPVFPHELASQATKNYGLIAATPYGNTLSFAFAKQAIDNEQMGKDSITDFLAISLSSPDYVGHQFGPNSIETEDTYLRLDKEVADFLNYLDKKVGKGQYTIFLSADHGVSHIPGFLKNNKMPGGLYSATNSTAVKNTIEKFGVKNLILSSANYQLYLNYDLLDSLHINRKEIKQFLVKELNKESNILLAFDLEEINAVNLPSVVKEKFVNGYNYKQSGDIQVVLKPGFFSGGNTGTTHGSWYPYDAHIPLLWFGWGIKKGKSNETHFMNDIAPTLAALLKIQTPNGTTGKVIPEVLK